MFAEADALAKGMKDLSLKGEGKGGAGGSGDEGSDAERSSGEREGAPASTGVKEAKAEPSKAPVKKQAHAVIIRLNEEIEEIEGRSEAATEERPEKAAKELRSLRQRLDKIRDQLKLEERDAETDDVRKMAKKVRNRAKKVIEDIMNLLASDEIGGDFATRHVSKDKDMERDKARRMKARGW